MDARSGSLFPSAGTAKFGRHARTRGSHQALSVAPRKVRNLAVRKRSSMNVSKGSLCRYLHSDPTHRGRDRSFIQGSIKSIRVRRCTPRFGGGGEFIAVHGALAVVDPIKKRTPAALEALRADVGIAMGTGTDVAMKSAQPAATKKDR
jgi:hypothetical protein